jgi:F0F1-type ATP synthase delta subunit
LAHKVYTSSVVARSIRSTVACRYASKAAAPAATTAATPAAKKTVANTQNADFEFAKARLNLPIRMYSKSGTFASRLYVDAEKGAKGDVDKVAASLEALKNELVAHPKLNAFLSSPARTPEQKRALLKQLVSTLKLHPTLATFADNLATKRNGKELLKIAKDFDALIKARDKVVNVKLTIASADQPKPKPETVQKVLNYSNDTKINLSVIVDPSIEGGAILAGPDRYVDLSFRKELTTLKANLAKKQAEAQQAKRTQFLQALSQYENIISP